jgi:hypothetical protein
VAAIVTNALATVEWQILRYPCRTPVDKLRARMTRFSRAFKRVRQRNESTLNAQAHSPQGHGVQPIDRPAGSVAGSVTHGGGTQPAGRPPDVSRPAEK